jgi:hypothetical protein
MKEAAITHDQGVCGQTRMLLWQDSCKHERREEEDRAETGLLTFSLGATHLARAQFPILMSKRVQPLLEPSVTRMVLTASLLSLLFASARSTAATRNAEPSPTPRPKLHHHDSSTQKHA